MATNKKYWKGLEELNEAPHFVEKRDSEFPAELAVEEFVGSDKVSDFKTGRRDFLKFLGFSVAAASLAACEKPVIKAIPYVNKPEDVTPGVASWYASTYYDGNDFANVLVKAREARPIHIKGNKKYGVTQGGINARIGASVLSMYNGARLKQPQIKTEAGFSDLSWADADAKVKAGLNKAISDGKSVRILSRSIISPSTEMSIKALVSSYGGSVNTAMASESGVVDGTDTLAVDNIVAPVANGSADVKHVVYDAVSYHGIRKANENSFGAALIPSYDFSKAKTIVGIGCDFLNSWLLSTQYAVQYGITRNPDKADGKQMSQHFQFESLMSITGSNADVRTRIKPSQEGIIAAGILNALGGGGASAGELLDPACKKAAEALKANAGHSLVVAGSNDPKIQTIVNAINDKLGNYGTTLDLAKPTTLGQTNDEEVAKFVEELKGGKVGAVIVYDTNPVYSMPNGNEISEAIAACDFSVSMAMYNDETANACQVICPDNHYLESWNDYSPVAGHYAMAQPICRPALDTRQAQESLLVWAGAAERGSKDSKVYYEFIQDGWRQYGFPNQSEYSTFADYWNWAVHNGSVDMKMPAGNQPSFSGSIPSISAAAESDWELVTYQKSAIGTGNQAANPWLQEMPDPMSKVSWDNYATMAPADAMYLFGSGEGDVDTFGKHDSLYLGEQYPAKQITVTVGEKTLTLPVYPMPGQAVGTVGVALGYGRGAHATKDPLIGRAAYQTEEYGGHTLDENENLTPIGGNAFAMSAYVDGSLCYSGMSATVTLTGKEYPLACAQTHNTVMGRVSVVRETTLDYYKNGPKLNTKSEKGYNNPFTVSMIEDGEHKTKLVSEVDLWDEHPVANIGHRWGMSIDLSTCIGCGSCLIACQSENNVPVVGKDEVRRSRDMHWLRIDRYFSSIEDEQRELVRNAPWEGGYDYRKMEVPEASPEVTFMPMMCQHCNHAPCETVCPVAATTHSNEGLNQMTYNRCIGTRYCANNCPYKVRRFNWFNYQGYKKFSDVNPAQDQLGRMVLNPDVVVRSRGVMEKCSFCVQKIQSGKLVAKKAGRPVQDGDVTTACAESCPTNAISFGDWNDTKSEVRGLSEGDRAYQSLEEVGVEPNIWYQLKVRNHDEKAPQEIGVTEVAATDHVADEHNEAH